MAFNFSERYAANIRLDKTFQNNPELSGSFLNTLSNAYREREKKLFSQGYTIPSYLQILGVLDENYLDYANKQVLAYNQKFPDEPLYTNEQLQYSTLAQLNDTYGADLGIHGLGDLIGAFGAGFAAELTGHPLTFGAVFLAGGYLSAGLAATLALPGLAAVAGSAFIGGLLVSGISTYRAAVKNEVLRKAAPQVSIELGLNEDLGLVASESFIENLATGAALDLGVRGAFKIGRYTSKIGKKYTNINNARIDELAAAAKQAHPYERAQMADSIQLEQPSSILTDSETSVLVSDVRDFLAAEAENNTVAMQEIASKESPFPRMTEDSINMSREISVDFPEEFSHLNIDDVTSIENSVQNSVNEFNFRFKEEAINGTNNQLSRLGGSNGTQSADANAESIAEFTKQYILRNFPVIAESGDTRGITDSFAATINDIREAGMDFRGAGYREPDIKKLNQTQKELALKFNSQRNSMQYAEIAISAVKSETQKKWFKPKDLSNTILHVTNNYREGVQLQTQQIFRGYAAEISNAMESYSKGNGVAPDSAGVIDALLQSNKSSKYIGVANAVSGVFDKIHNLSIEAGITPLFDTEGYFPNRWSTKKFRKIDKQTFIADALEHFDTEKMNRVADSRNAPIKDMTEFLGDMYDSIFVASQKTTERIVSLRSGDSWVYMHRKYGEYETFIEAIEDALRSSNHKIRVGLSGTGSMQALQESINKIHSTSLKFIQDKNLIPENTDDLIRGQLIDILYDNQGMSYGNNWSDRIGNLFLGYARLQRKAMLSLSFITAYFSDRFASTPIMARTIGIENSEIFKTIASNLLSVGNLEDIRLNYDLSLNYAKSLSSQLSDLEAVSLTQKSIKGLTNGLKFVTLDSPIRLLSIVAEQNEALAMKFLGGHLAKISPKTWGELPQITRNALGDSGITAADWDVYRRLPNILIGKSELKSVNYIRGLVEANDSRISNPNLEILDNVLKKFKVLENQARLAGSPQNTALGNAGAIKASRGKFMNALIYSIAPFLNIVNTTARISTRSARELSRTGMYGSAAAVPVLLITAGYFTWRAKKLAQGNTNPKLDNNAILTILLNSGLLNYEQTLVLEHIFGNQYSSNGNIPLPLVNTVVKAPFDRFVLGKNINWYKTASRDVKSSLPIANLGMFGMILSKYTTNIVFRALDPQGARELDNELYRKLMHNDINEMQYFLSKPPGQD